MKFSKENFLWIILFFLFLGLGYLQGSRPQSFEKSQFIAPTKIRILSTEEELFPAKFRQKIETDLNVQFEFIVNKSWQDWLANTIADPAADILFLPSYWSQALFQQNLLDSFPVETDYLQQRVSSEFDKRHLDGSLTFFPLYWMKTALIGPKEKDTFTEFLKNKDREFIYLWADQDLLLSHFRVWKNQGLWDLAKTKKILTVSLDDLYKKSKKPTEIIEAPLDEGTMSLDGSKLSALLIWGVSIPKNAKHKELVIEVLERLTQIENQDALISESPFSSALNEVATELPLSKRAVYIRDLNLTDTILIDKKDVEAEKRLVEEFDFTF